jgi:undecaprenyl-diphosphatase
MHATVEAVSIRRYLLPAAVVAAFVLLLLVARWVLAGESIAFDLWIRGTVHSWASPFLTRVMLGITMLGSEKVMLPLGTVLVWRLATLGHRRQVILLAAGSLGAEQLSYLLKLAFHRPRPPVFFGLSPAENYSFPSGHAFVGTVFYGLLAGILAEFYSRRRKEAIAAAVLTVLLVGFSRVYLGYHYPTDVIGGWTCAAGWLAMVKLASGAGVGNPGAKD